MNDHNRSSSRGIAKELTGKLPRAIGRLPIIINRLAEWTVVGSFPGERIGTVVTYSRFVGNMEDDRHRIMEGKAGDSIHLLRGHDMLPSSRPRGHTTP